MNTLPLPSAPSLKVRAAAALHGFFRRAHQRAVLKPYRFVHVMNNGIHSAGIVEFVNRNFDPAEHAFVFPVTTAATRERLAGRSNVYQFGLDGLHPGGAQRIIFHGLFTDEVVTHLHRHPELLRRSSWFIWGGDLYNAPGDPVHNAVRRGFAGVITSFDRDVYTARYGDTPRFFDVAYPHELDEEMLDPRLAARKPGQVHIQINNSADETTLEMLDTLGRFRDEDIKVSTVLSYISHGQDDCRLQILRRGEAIFGAKFNPIMQFMPLAEYASHLSTVDVYISNQNRQQGNGNAAFICSLGGKVFVKSDTPVYRTYADRGIRYFDTYDIATMSFQELTARDPVEKAATTSLLRERMSEPYKVRQWGGLFAGLARL